MNILKLLFGKKVKQSFETSRLFLEKKFASIAKYIYHGRVFISECPIVIDNQLYYNIYFIGKDSKKLGEIKIELDDLFVWMGIIKSKEN